jgi:hypothetical protein
MDQYLGYLAGFMLAITLLSIVVQLVFAYALQTLAYKNEMSSLAETLAWLPILNLYPFIACGGGSFSRFLIGVAVFFAGAIGLGIASGMSGGEGGMAFVAVGFALIGSLVTLVYFGRIFWRTAERRGLSGFIGLLSFVPVVNLLVYPYIAFHDGLVPVNRIGAALGFLLIAGPSIASYQLSSLATLAAQTQMAESGDDGSMGMAAALAMLSGSGNVQPDLEATKIGMQIAMLDPSDPEVMEQIVEIHQQIAEVADTLPADRADFLRDRLATTEQQIPEDSSPEEEVLARMHGGGLAVTGSAQPSSQRQHFAPPAAPGAGSGRAYTPQQALPVPGDMSCQPGTLQRGNPDEKTWCEQTGGGIKHGWSSSRHRNGQLAAAGQYRDGLRHGVWTRWYDDGALRVQAEFERDLQDGQMIAWDRNGNVTAVSRFEAGELVQR